MPTAKRNNRPWVKKWKGSNILQCETCGKAGKSTSARKLTSTFTSGGMMYQQVWPLENVCLYASKQWLCGGCHRKVLAVMQRLRGDVTHGYVEIPVTYK